MNKKLKANKNNKKKVRKIEKKETNNSIAKKKVKAIEFEQQISYLKFNIEDLETMLKKEAIIRDYAYIIHNADKDEKGKKVKPHIHCLLRFTNATEFQRIIKIFKTDDLNRLQNIKTTFPYALAYLTHRGKPEKYQYKDEEVISNFDFIKERQTKTNKAEDRRKFDEMLQQLIDGTLKEYDVDAFMEEHQIDTMLRIKRAKDIKIACDVFNVKMMSKKDRKMKVIYVKGESGMGKTFFAKYLARQEGYEPYITSANDKDMFGEYRQEPCVIVDDIKENLELQSILKLLDPFTSSAVASRYRDKSLACVELLIITSTLSLDKTFAYKDIDREQIYRRIPLLFEVKKNTIDIFKVSTIEKGGRYYGWTKQALLTPYKTIDNPLIEELKKQDATSYEEEMMQFADNIVKKFEKKEVNNKSGTKKPIEQKVIEETSMTFEEDIFADF